MLIILNKVFETKIFSILFQTTNEVQNKNGVSSGSMWKSGYSYHSFSFQLKKNSITLLYFQKSADSYTLCMRDTTKKSCFENISYNCIISQL